MPGASLLLPCQPPPIADGESDNDYARDMIELARAYKLCERRQADLAAWVRGR